MKIWICNYRSEEYQEKECDLKQSWYQYPILKSTFDVNGYDIANGNNYKSSKNK